MTAPMGPVPSRDAPETQACETQVRSAQVRSEARHPPQTHDRVVLDRRYGAIGISAVAAALRYGGAGKNPAYAQAPATARLDARLYDLAAS